MIQWRRAAVKPKSCRQIGAAIETCIDVFYLTRNPQLSVAKTLDTLERIGWRSSDIGRVERIVCKALSITQGSAAPKKAA
jgi:hypothetical protein